MKLEYRIAWVDDINPAVYPNMDILGIGSESCPVPLFQQELPEKIAETIRQGMPVKLVTPRIAQKDINKMAGLLQAIQKKGHPIDIVINDWGLFYYCSKRKDLFHMHIGRQLCRSLLDCPWNEEIGHNETESVKGIIAGHPYADRGRLDYLLENGVVGVELNTVDERLPAADKMRAAGLQTALHEENILLSCGAVCLAKRLDPDLPCKVLCKKRYQAHPESKWLDSLHNKVPFSAHESALLKGLQIQGNTVTLPQKGPLPELACTDTLITTQIKKLTNRSDKNEKALY